MSSSERLRMGTKLGFGVGAVSDGAIVTAFNAWNFLFYNQVLGLSGTLAGLAVTISLILDGISEPLVGSLSDRWRSKLGRRHPFLYAAPIPLAISFYLLYAPPSGLTGVPLFLWFTAFATLHRQALTIYQVPHLALGAELSNDYHERSIIMSYTLLFGVVGGAGAAMFGWSWLDHHPGKTMARENYVGIAAMVSLMSAVAIFASAHFTRDQIPRLKAPSTDVPRLSLLQLAREIGDCLSNHNYRNLLLGLFSLSATFGTLETLQSHVSLFFWQLPAKTLKIFPLITLPAFILAFIMTVRLHRRFDKRLTIIGALLLATLAVATPITLRLLGIFPGPGAKGLVPLLMMFTFLYYTGFATLTISVLSALADVADEHELNTGRRQEGVFYAARTFFSKLSTGLGHVLAGAAIDIIKFPVKAAPGTVPEDVLAQLGFVQGPLAAIPAFIAIIFYARYRIDKQRHAEIQRALAERRRPANAAAPGVAGDAAAGSVEPAPI
ncbi:MAG TPA: MFS transporter [Polyangiales bacterium]|nr:MFS transporter [Polyangiales bacterium]